MNILWLYNRPLNPQAGGTERITSLIMRGLSARGHNCFGLLVFDLANGSMNYKDECIDDLYDFLIKNNINVVINQDALDVTLLNSFLDRGGLAWKNGGGKLITCLHFDPKYPSRVHLFLSKRNKKIKDWLIVIKCYLLKGYYEWQDDVRAGKIYGELYDKSDFFVTLSESHFPYLREVMKKKDYSKMVAINNPLTFTETSDNSIIKRKSNTAIVVARMDEYYKRISLVLKAWEYVKKNQVSSSWNLILVGNGPDYDFYSDIVRKKKLSDVMLVGRQDPDDYYKTAKLYLMTSVSEGWGLALTESFQRAVVPVVMDSCVVFSEIIQDGYNGLLVKNNDVKLYAESIIRLMQDNQLWEKMANNALLRSLDFDIDIITSKWESLF